MGVRRTERRWAAGRGYPRGRAAPYLRPRGWRCQRWCAPPACAWKSPGSGSDREPEPKPWPAVGDGDRRRKRRQPTVWSLLLCAPNAAGLSCSSWTKERAALRVLGYRPAEVPWSPPPALLRALGAEFPGGGHRRQSKGTPPPPSPPAEQPRSPSQGLRESQRANRDIRMWAGGHSSERLWGSRLPSSKAKQEWAKTPSSFLPSPKYPSNEKS